MMAPLLLRMPCCAAHVSRRAARAGGRRKDWIGEGTAHSAAPRTGRQGSYAIGSLNLDVLKEVIRFRPQRAILRGEAPDPPHRSQTGRGGPRHDCTCVAPPARRRPPASASVVRAASQRRFPALTQECHTLRKLTTGGRRNPRRYSISLSSWDRPRRPLPSFAGCRPPTS